MDQLLRTGALALSTVLASLTFAQDKATTAPRPTLDAREQAAMQKPVPDGFQPMNLGMLIKQLGLTPEQQEEAKQLNARYLKMHRSLPENMPMDDRKMKVKSMMEERDAAFKAFLNKEQVDQYGKLVTPTGAKVSPTAEPKK
jgi:hypothetical protein